jgi:two-component system, chemotaxis family, CheB/CheR fusion protein
LRLTDIEITTQETEGFDQLLDYLKRSRGFDFRAYKTATLQRRIQRRMTATGSDSFEAYHSYLEENPGEFAELFNTFLINVTAFFRDGDAWEYIAQEVVPALMAQKGRFDVIRVWSAGCATGQEAYTIAMILSEAIGLQDFATRVKIYATDIDDHALSVARHASFDPKDVESVPPEMLDRYFERINGNFCIRKDLRRTMVFGRHDVLQDAPISKIDLLICRNTLMYFNASAQARILARLHFSLNDAGYLFLGRAETLLSHSSTYRPVNLKHRIFSKVPSARLGSHLYLMSGDDTDNRGRLVQSDESVKEQALDTSGVAQLVVDREGNLVVANQHARMLFGLSLRDIGVPFQNLELSYKPVELRSLIDQAYADQRKVVGPAVEHHRLAGQSIWLEPQVVPLTRNVGEPNGVSILFCDVTNTHRLQSVLERTNLEFENASEQLQSANEELETTNEELQSAVEELETTNEELQASYEELETMNEELQSTNEELQAINDVARAYTTELDTANHLLDSIFSGLGGHVIVVDQELNVTFWNKGAEDLWGVRAVEVVNTPLTALDFGLPLDQLTRAIDKVLSGGSEREIRDILAVNRRGRSITCHLTIVPLMDRNGETVVGAIIVASDEPVS